MFPWSLLPVISSHDACLFGRSPEWQDPVFGRDSLGSYDRRPTREDDTAPAARQGDPSGDLVADYVVQFGPGFGVRLVSIARET